MASLRHLLSRITSNGFSHHVIRRWYVKSLYEDALSLDTTSSSSASIECRLINGNVFTNPNVEFGSKRFYKGRVKGIVFDWGGTVVDSGVCAPIYTFVELFHNEGVVINEDEARSISGSNRMANIAQILDKEAVRKRWIEANGKEPTTEDVQRMHDNFIPQVLSSLTKYSNVIEGVAKPRTDGLIDGFFKESSGQTRTRHEIDLVLGIESTLFQIWKKFVAALGITGFTPFYGRVVHLIDQDYHMFNA
ncbi:unnamed protein product [Oppiella nova]|uniref:Uncharacterized protein n=1 Tax=Oppiella nova TaxID=334625 RepID=A0A7R9MAX0_9ACAR|nr:unnamed protein product [Oppiella nova]CAG2172909.1 unnamed protein product [Oppiella nova]